MKRLRKKPLPRLGVGEIDLMEMLWRKGAVTLSEAHEAFGKPIGYTTVQTRLNRLVTKGFVVRTADRPAKYQACVAQQEINSHDLDVLVDRVNSGSVAPLVAHLLKERDVSAEELAVLKQLISDAEKRLKN